MQNTVVPFITINLLEVSSIFEYNLNIKNTEKLYIKSKRCFIINTLGTQMLYHNIRLWVDQHDKQNFECLTWRRILIGDDKIDGVTFWVNRFFKINFGTMNITFGFECIMYVIERWQDVCRYTIKQSITQL